MTLSQFLEEFKEYSKSNKFYLYGNIAIREVNSRKCPICALVKYKFNKNIDNLDYDEAGKLLGLSVRDTHLIMQAADSNFKFVTNCESQEIRYKLLECL